MQRDATDLRESETEGDRGNGKLETYEKAIQRDARDREKLEAEGCERPKRERDRGKLETKGDRGRVKRETEGDRGRMR